jgi:hypothetical protein
MRNFLLKYYKTDDVSLKAVDHYMITQYSMYLKTEMGCNYNTATKFTEPQTNYLLGYSPWLAA